MASPTAKVLRRFKARIKTDHQEVFLGEYVQPKGLPTGIVRLGQCQQDVDAARSTNHAKGASVLAVGTDGVFAILPGPTSRPGPSSASTTRLPTAPFVPPEPPVDEILTLQVLVSTGATSSDIHPGEVNITQGTWNLDTGTTIASIAWTGLVPPITLGHKFWPLPDGGPGVAANSVAAAVELDTTGTNFGANGRSAIKVWDSLAATVTERLSSAVGMRFRQPVPDDGLWWLVEYTNPSGAAELQTLPLDLSAAATTIHATGFADPNNPLQAFHLTSGNAVSAEIRTVLLPPNDCWVFDRVPAGNPSNDPYTPLLYEFSNPGQSGRPDTTAVSWTIRPQAAAGRPSELSVAATVTESAIGGSDTFDGLAPVATEMPLDPASVMVAGHNRLNGNPNTLAIGIKATGVFIGFDNAQSLPIIQAAWVER